MRAASEGGGAELDLDRATFIIAAADSGFLDVLGPFRIPLEVAGDGRAPVRNPAAALTSDVQSVAYTPTVRRSWIWLLIKKELRLQQMTFAVSALYVLGAGGVLLLFTILFLRIWRTAQMARDHLGALLCAGVLVCLLWHVFENAGMNMGIMPITGIPLPFLSYGGSSTVAFFIMIGLVQNVHLRKL